MDAARGTPGAAIVVSGGLCLLGIVVWAPFVGAADYYGDLAKIGALVLILVYVGVTGAELVEALEARRLIGALFGLAGMLVLLWPLFNSVHPIPDLPRTLRPHAVIAWIVAGAWLATFRPALREEVLPNMTPGQGHRNRSPQAAFTEMSNDC